MSFAYSVNKIFILAIFTISLTEISINTEAKVSQKPVVNDIFDIKDFKKLLRTKNNVLTLFINSPKESSNIIKIFEDTAENIKGQGTMVMIDCLEKAKKLCKKLKVPSDPYVLKHYKDGDFFKNYDRKETASSMLNFMRDPSGDIPWDEDSNTAGIMHIPDSNTLTKFLRKESGPVMVMFYAPWCGFCKQLKPEYAAAALELKGHSILAAIDVNKPENVNVRGKYNITGFPTLIYFENGIKKFNYDGENNKKSIVEFMKNPSPAPPKPVEVDWSTVENEVKHLTDITFDEILNSAGSALVMFYAPWCGHCKRLKPEYEKAAEKLKNNKIDGILAALDATKETKTAKKFNVNGYPTLKYFKRGEFQYDVNLREEKELIEFMKNPKRPPPPEKPWVEEESEVVHLNTETFKTFLRKKKYALVMFYAPWCGHCKKAKPEFTAAAETFKDDARLEFAAIDCTSHSSVCSAYNVKGYPTIKLFHYLNKDPPEDYVGGRTERDFTSFMKKFSSRNSFQTSSLPNLEEDKVEKVEKIEKIEKVKKVEKAEKAEKAEKIEKVEKAEKLSKKSSGEDDWSQIANADLILHLEDGNFDYSLKKHEFLLIFFYQNDCEECKKLKVEFSNLALMLVNSKMTGKAAAYNASKNKKIAKEKNVNSYPLIQFYKKGNFVANYSGKYSSSDLFNFLKKSVSKKDEL